MNTLTKTLVGTAAAGAMALSAASPSLAQDRRHRDHDGIGAGEVIAGALIVGGIAALAAGASNDRGRRWDSRWGNPRQAVERCVIAAERQASRRSWGRNSADVTDIRDVRNTPYGYEVRGRIAVNTMNRGWRSGDQQYGRGWNGDYRGWNDRLRGYDAGSFVCRIDRGRVGRIDFNGIRGL